MNGVARLGDMHVCPGMTGPAPHVGGPVKPGPRTVFVDGRPVACVGDMCLCVGPPDAISRGSGSVFAGNLPVAHRLSGTAHGGVVLQGSTSVFVG